MNIIKKLIRILFSGLLERIHTKEQKSRDIGILYNHLNRCSFHTICIYDASLSEEKSIRKICKKLGIIMKRFGEEIDSGDENVLHVLCSGENACRQNNDMLNAGVFEKCIFRLHMSEDEKFSKLDVYDTLLGYTRQEDYEGFTVFGDISASNRIVVLGNSTSDNSCGRMNSWVKYFSDIIINKYDDYCIISGAIMASTSTQETLKLYRDALNFEPTLVISYSGITDAYNEHFNNKNFFTLDYQIDSFATLIGLYKKRGVKRTNKTMGKDVVTAYSYGVKTQRTRAENWLFNERVMHAICSELNIEFVGILQPYIFSDRSCDVYHEYIVEKMNSDELEETKMFYESVKENLNNYPFIIDMSEAFADKEGIYKDYCHMLERGNIILADYIFNCLKGHFK